MAKRDATARWEGQLKDGNGSLALGTGALKAPYSFQSRFEEGNGTNPEELIAGAQAGCYAMQLAAELTQADHSPDSIEANANVHLRQVDGAPRITQIDITVTGRVPGLDAEEFAEYAAQAKANCLITKALAGVEEINVEARLES